MKKKMFIGNRDFERAVSRQILKLLIQRAKIDLKIMMKERELCKLESFIQDKK